VGEPRRQTRICDAFLSLGALLAALAPILLVVEIVEWLVTGQWPGWSIENGLMFFGFERPLAHFSVTEFVLDILVSLPLALGLYAAGLLIFKLAIDAADKIETR
jgi:hypothetical protein